MKLALILADQLSHTLASLRSLDPQRDVLLLAEVMEEASYVAHHQQKIALLFSAMRHFAAELRQQGWTVYYHALDDTLSGAPGSRTPAMSAPYSLQDVLQHYCRELDAEAVVVTECGEHRLQQQIDQHWPQALGIELQCYQDDRFICSQEEFQRWANGRKQLRMEYFYRDMRRKTGLLMDHDQPVGGQWNFDQDNRKRYNGEVPLVPRLMHQHDDTDQQVLSLVQQHFSHHPGRLDHFLWGTTRDQALAELDHFIEHRLPWFGHYQDAMKTGEHTLFHSLISPYLNCGLLTPLEVCQKAEQAYLNNRAPLNAVEGFIRQIIGWREYVRGIYWLHMPHYSEQNALNNQRPLPDMSMIYRSWSNMAEDKQQAILQRAGLLLANLNQL